MKNCPNCGIPLDEKGNCPKCHYSFAPLPRRGNAKINEVNAFIKGYLSQLRNSPPSASRWVQSWAAVPKRNFVTGYVYRGINRITTRCVMDDFFLTRNQIEKMGGSLKEGAKKVPIIFWLPPDKTREDEDVTDGKPRDEREKKKRDYPIMLLYYVYGQHDVEGIPYKEVEVNAALREPKDLIDFVREKGARIEFYGSRACYDPSEDKIYIPAASRFASEDEFAITVAHEFAHWAIARIKSIEKSDEKARAREEMAAEIAALYIASMFGIAPNENAVRYINGWLKITDDDVYAFVSATQLAEKVLELVK